MRFVRSQISSIISLEYIKNDSIKNDGIKNDSISRQKVKLKRFSHRFFFKLNISIKNSQKMLNSLSLELFSM